MNYVAIVMYASATLSVLMILGMIVFFGMRFFNLGKRLFIPIKVSSDASQLLSITAARIVSGTCETNYECDGYVLKITEHNTPTVYVISDPRSAFFGCFSDDSGTELRLNEFPDRKSMKEFNAVLDKSRIQRKMINANTDIHLV